MAAEEFVITRVFDAPRDLVFNATDAERKAFEAGHKGMQAGFGGTYDNLAEYLASAAKGQAK